MVSVWFPERTQVSGLWGKHADPFHKSNDRGKPAGESSQTGHSEIRYLQDYRARTGTLLAAPSEGLLRLPNLPAALMGLGSQLSGVVLFFLRARMGERWRNCPCRYSHPLCTPTQKACHLPSLWSTIFGTSRRPVCSPVCRGHYKPLESDVFFSADPDPGAEVSECLLAEPRIFEDLHWDQELWMGIQLANASLGVTTKSYQGLQ